MKLTELESLKECNELDLIYKISEIAEIAKKRSEKILKSNKSAGVDVRKLMQDIRLLSEIVRDEIQRRFSNTPMSTQSRLDKAIKLEKRRLANEEAQIKNLEEKRNLSK